MKFNTGDKLERQKAVEYLSNLAEKGSNVEVKRLSERRTLSQNAYLHVLFQIFAIDTGYTVQEAKDVIKNDLGYTYYKNGRIFYKKTSKMDTKELNTFIEKFRVLASEQGIYLPKPGEVGNELLNWIEKNNKYL